MARTIKIDNALQKRFSYQGKKKSKKKELSIYFLIVCEGKKTEPNYFKSFPKKVDNFVFDIECDGGGMNTLKVVETAIKLRDNSTQKYDRVWAVFDRDSFPAKNFDNAILKAKANNICCAWSNEAFELWYLLHFQYRSTGMKRTEYQKAIEDEINKNWKDKKKPFKYEKNDPNMYDVLQEYGKQGQAINWAEQLRGQYNDEKFAAQNPRTQVYELVRQLIGQDDKLNEEIRNDFANKS
ncbi:hypothetical protein FACS1894181_11680 [Bacteroidia bacterium]|nr:hypothetical protein FACS1894181_11680 [Bacteroidia bacterium]